MQMNRTGRLFRRDRRLALAYARRTGFDLNTEKIILVDPETHEPVRDEHGKVINPT